MQVIQPERSYLIRLLSSVMEGAQPPDPPEKIDWDMLYRLSARHSVSNMLWYGLKKLGQGSIPPPEVMERFRADYNKAAGKEAMQHIMLEKVLKVFEENQIPCIPLKGCLLKHLYPHPDMRLMADIDILFKTEQTEQVKLLMTELSFTMDPMGGENHDCYGLPPYMRIEMHRRLVSENSPYSAYLDKTWDRARPKADCRYICELSREDFFIYLLIHLTKHYAAGGTGIRSFLDIWVYDNRYACEMDWNYVNNELDKIGLLKFAEHILGLCAVWFGNAQSNALYDDMATYVLDSGSYGTKKHAVISSMSTTSKEERSIRSVKYRYGLKLFFPSFHTMVLQYPFLKAVPFLLPVCWLLRGLKCIIFKRGRTLQMMNKVQSVSTEELIKMKHLHERAGLLRQ